MKPHKLLSCSELQLLHLWNNIHSSGLLGVKGKVNSLHGSWHLENRQEILFPMNWYLENTYPKALKELSFPCLNLSSMLCQDVLIKRGKPQTFVKNHNLVRSTRVCNISKETPISVLIKTVWSKIGKAQIICTSPEQRFRNWGHQRFLHVSNMWQR